MRKYFKSMMALSIFLLTACGGGKKSEANTDNEVNIPSVKVANVSARPVAQIFEYTGTIEPEFKNNIAPSTPLRIEKILVEVGDFVKKNQPLVKMDTSGFKQLQLQLENEKAEFERIDELYKVGGVSKSEWDLAKMALDIRKTAYSNLLENTTLLSPIEGVISVRNYDNGDMYTGNGAIVTVEKIAPVKLLVNISESLYAQVHKGQKVTIKLDVYPNETFEGNISIVYPTINPDTRTFNVEIKINNINKKIRPGMYARAELNYGEVDRVVVPDLAVIKQVGSGDRFVYVYKDGKVYYKKVELGRRLGNEIELISGVENNSQVVIAGQSRLANDIAVELLK